MKENIFNYDQRKLLASGLDTDELMILDYISYFKSTGLMEEHIKDGKSWHWISWKKIEMDMPFLRLKKDAIQRKCLYYLGIKPEDWEERVSKMSEKTKKKVSTYKFLGMLEFSTIGKKGEEKTIFRFTENWYKLLRKKGETLHVDPKMDKKKDLPVAADKSPLNNKSINQSNSICNDSIPQNDKNIQEKNKNLDLILNSGIKDSEKLTIKQKNEIEKWDLKLLEECIEYMCINCDDNKFTFAYLSRIYKNPFFRVINKFKNENKVPKINTRFHNVNHTFAKYSPDELEKMLLESQKGKFDSQVDRKRDENWKLKPIKASNIVPRQEIIDLFLEKDQEEQFCW